MPAPLAAALAEVRALLLDPRTLARAVAAGHRRNQTPSVVRAELRPVSLRSGPHLQIVTSDGTRPHTRNVPFGTAAETAVDALLAEPFANWHVQTGSTTLQLRVTKRGEAQLHRTDRPQSTDVGRPSTRDRGAPDERPPAADLATDTTATTAADRPATTATTAADRLPPHDRTANHLLDPGDPLFDVLGGSAAKRRQVDAFLRALAATLPDDPTALPSPLRVVDLGCGNAYLTFAAHRWLTAHCGLDVRLLGVDVREDQRRRNTEVADRLGVSGSVTFVAATIAEAEGITTASAAGDLARAGGGADVVLALHACDTATDEALARAVGWQAGWVLAAPCCHHDISAQLKGRPAPAAYDMVVRHAILRERFADVLTDSLRAALLRLHGYRVDVVEFVESRHTPRNLLLRARYTGAAPTPGQRAEFAALTSAWGVTPELATRLGYDTTSV